LPEPYIVNAIEDQLLQAGFESTTVDLTDVFGEDLDGKENLAFVVSSSDETVLTTSVDGTTLTLTEVGFGMTNISVQASNPTLGGTSVTDVFMVRVNANPITTDIPDTDVDIEFGSTQFDLMDFFSDPNGDTITFSITNSNTGAVDVSISEDSVLTITEVAEGSSTLIIPASDGFGGSVEDQIIFRVLGPNKAPTLADAFDNLSFFEGFDNETIDLDGAFADEDGDDLTYSVSVSDESVVTAVVGGTFLIIEEVGLGTATFTITADDGRGGTASDAFSVTVEELILGLDLVNGLEVYPNPVKEYLTIFGFQEINTITLFDLVGRKIANFTPDVQGEEAIINMSSLAKGSYLLKIEADGETHLKRVIKE
ncbi:MAG: hypothetical protein CMB89_08470, partial [Flammeovirgaceae bacterium]|nr:hypothetical protein [Flammeovirgaceae bacterium]